MISETEELKKEESQRAFSIRWARNSVFFFTSQLFSKGLFFLTTIYLARTLGVTEYGKFAFAFGFVTLFSVLTKFGLDLLTSKEVGENTEQASRYFRATFTLRSVFSVAFVILIFISTLFLGKSPEINRLMLLLAVSASLQSIAGAGTSLLEGLQSFVTRSVFMVLMYGSIFVMLLMFLYFQADLHSVGSAFLTGAVLYAAITLTVCHFMIAPVAFTLDTEFLKGLFLRALPLGLTEMFIGVYYRIDTVLLSLLTSDKIVGWYDAAYTFVYGLRLLPVTVAMVLLPGLSSMYSRNTVKAAGLYRKTLFYSIAIGTCLTFLVMIHSERLVDFVFGVEYRPSATIVPILIWTCVVMFVNAFQGILLVITDQRMALFRATAIGALSNLFLNLYFIPKWDMYGAAVVTVLSEFFVFVVSAFYLRSFMSWRDFARFCVTPLFAITVLFFLYKYFGEMQFVFLSLICVMVYSAIFVATRKFVQPT